MAKMPCPKSASRQIVKSAGKQWADGQIGKSANGQVDKSGINAQLATLNETTNQEVQDGTEGQHKPIRLYDLETGECIGEITEEQLQALIETFEEEHLEDRDYYVHRATLPLIKGAELVALLEKALGEREEMDIGWEREGSGQSKSSFVLYSNFVGKHCLLVLGY